MKELVKMKELEVLIEMERMDRKMDIILETPKNQDCEIGKLVNEEEEVLRRQSPKSRLFSSSVDL